MVYCIPILCKVAVLPFIYKDRIMCNTKTLLQHEDFIKLGQSGVFNFCIGSNGYIRSDICTSKVVLVHLA